jgi:hypothetical protein
MSFRKDNQSSLEWGKWKKLHGQKLLILGLPESILKSESLWWHFLEHGYDSESDWEPSNLNRKDAEALLEFLESEYKNGEAWSCISDVRDATSL